MRSLLLTMFSALIGIAVCADHVQVVGATKIQFTLPDRWTKTAAPNGGQAFMFTNEAGKRYSLVINKQPNSKGMAHLKAIYERDFPKGLKDFKLVRSEMSKVNTFDVLLIEHTNTTPGAPIRQFFYIVDLGDPSVFFTFSELEDVGDAVHAEYNAVINSIKKVD